MVTIEEYGTQLQQRRQQLENTERSVSQRRMQFSRQQLINMLRIQKKIALKKFTYQQKEIMSRVQQQLKEQQQLEKRFVPAKLQQLKYNEALEKHNAYESAKRMYEKRVPTSRTTGLERYYLKRMYKGATAQKEYDAKWFQPITFTKIPEVTQLKWCAIPTQRIDMFGTGNKTNEAFKIKWF